jgi:hypothetical protein
MICITLPVGSINRSMHARLFNALKVSAFDALMSRRMLWVELHCMEYLSDGIYPALTVYDAQNNTVLMAHAELVRTMEGVDAQA